MASTDSRERLRVLRRILGNGQSSTQEDLVDELSRLNIDITQSTISRDLRRIGAVKATSPEGVTVYRLESENRIPPAAPSSSLRHLLLDMSHNSAIIIIHTALGSASLIAAHLDRVKIQGVLGTIAGDDTVLVAIASTPPSSKNHSGYLRLSLTKGFS